jgi:molybdenum cofactor guanylyltransferase
MIAMTMTSISGVPLAGGLAERMGGGDTPMRMVDGRTVLEPVTARLAPQCSGLALNANGDPARFASCGLTVVLDGMAGFRGRFAGILAGPGRSCRSIRSSMPIPPPISPSGAARRAR